MFKLFKWLTRFKAFHFTYLKGTYGECPLFYLRIVRRKTDKVLFEKRTGPVLLINTVLSPQNLQRFNGCFVIGKGEGFLSCIDKKLLLVTGKEERKVQPVTPGPSVEMNIRYNLIFGKLIKLLKEFHDVEHISIRSFEGKLKLDALIDERQTTVAPNLDFTQYLSLKEMGVMPNPEELYYLAFLFYNLIPPAPAVALKLGDVGILRLYGSSFSYELYKGKELVLHTSVLNNEKHNLTFKSRLKDATTYANLKEETLQQLHKEIDEEDNLNYVCVVAEGYKRVVMYDNMRLNNNNFN